MGSAPVDGGNEAIPRQPSTAPPPQTSIGSPGAVVGKAEHHVAAPAANPAVRVAPDATAPGETTSPAPALSHLDIASLARSTPSITTPSTAAVAVSSSALSWLIGGTGGAAQFRPVNVAQPMSSSRGQLAAAVARIGAQFLAISTELGAQSATLQTLNSAILADASLEPVADQSAVQRVFRYARMRLPFYLLNDSLAAFANESASLPKLISNMRRQFAWAVTASVLALDAAVFVYCYRQQKEKKRLARILHKAHIFSNTAIP